MRALLDIASVSPERRATVLSDIQVGSRPTAAYYVLLGLSELIAGFALIVGSDATLIGANVVAPLMTPIFGISLGLMRGDLRLLRTAVLAEFGGAAFGAALCFVLGLMPFMLDPTPVLLAQTRPTLIDLFVAALAGFAGGLAMIDERISPALPGVAIATALNPPIAALGLCLAYGAYQGAWGAFLLFFANVLAVLAVAAVLFVAAGFVTRAEIGSLRGLARRFAPAAIGLVVVTALLTNYLATMVRTLRTTRTITAVLDEQLSREPNTALVSLDFSRSKDAVEVLSTVSAPRVISPPRVKQIQDALASQLGGPVRLFVRCNLTKDVTATGSANVRPYLSLNGRVTEEPLAPQMQLVQQAEQVAREVVATRPDIVLKDIELVEFSSGPVLVVSIESPRSPSPANVARLEALLRERLAETHVRVVVRTAASVDVTSKGRILLGEAHFGEASADELRQREAVEGAVRSRLQGLPNVFVTAVDAVRQDVGWVVRADVVAPRVPVPGEILAVEQGTAKAIGEPVELTVRASTEIVVTGTQYRAVEQSRVPEADDP
ncbi:MAG TPA: DUF389 domain-containing protein [Candidatus Binatus sp.]|nr:DUF389 domain-containing protein [Candidatus Binatus sp.]